MSKKSLIDKLENMPSDRKALLNRLKRVEGQLRGIQRMIIEDKPCHDILLQLSAARKAMQNACIAILKNYIKNCIEESKSPDLEQMERLIGTLIEISPPASCTSEDEDDN
ncbi:protein of unknown function DUF156 [Thermovirga lienii DSM 17291]|jgi:DNA-binding FrmR family transcriptional regulator|uniref:Metal sensitive transcriptional repressor n=1 Tax=Thermovirga lienii (strain ATCC BAA-1197 / DSM 17291 / Cas60314) TaxID=580340 RepID=G7V5D3_THELD|nr:metal-sensitive transcriptional regulator [Thermovirga lienii]MDN5318064.1 CsoR family transcriptional regulator, copper-sensing transcriptional repressor [Thermovirga sp.]AER66916.1 protein of unknown function DUF156 [Thermovirga lienii DSM 17291]KUK42291.1 MAG: Uncharacterized protein XD70_0890 [Thermovirga lienii]MDN5367593.1 CsoR family transcriptional regulator, copper-sensing transcriptional repressor [Thermovirga sp.]HCD71989.1 transcriptional regulator [Thermovirga lienii]